MSQIYLVWYYFLLHVLWCHVAVILQSFSPKIRAIMSFNLYVYTVHAVESSITSVWKIFKKFQDLRAWNLKSCRPREQIQAQQFSDGIGQLRSHEVLMGGYTTQKILNFRCSYVHSGAFWVKLHRSILVLCSVMVKKNQDIRFFCGEMRPADWHICRSESLV